MRVTTKGQVTIPQHIREAAGFLPHTEVEFTIRDGVVRIAKATGRKPGRGEALVARMRGRGDVPMTTDEIMALTRDAIPPDPSPA